MLPRRAGDRKRGIAMSDQRGATHGYLLTVDLAETTESAFAVDLHRRIVYWNAGAETLLGCLSGDVLGRTCCDVLDKHAAGVPSACRSCVSAVAQGRADALSRQFDVFAAGAAGHVQRVRVVAIRSRNIAGEPRIIHLLRTLDATAGDAAIP